ncbi:MAG: ImmA/IrrE family metallo-endopeptidase, partial [Candidatus Tectomicrobia bacterium]|nr:ImmA/IrrE family metallo-endopeptidase [Candidatus Tectomicrobia bacterium]
NPFEVRSGQIGKELDQTLVNVKRDGIRIHGRQMGSQRAGSIRCASLNPTVFLEFPKSATLADNERIPVRYELTINLDLSPEARYVTLVHELAHLYCGHLGTPNKNGWPDRRGLPHGAREFEAESVAYLVCSRLGIDNPSAEYLGGYANTREQVPPISLECVIKSASLIENMGRQLLKPRKARISP